MTHELKQKLYQLQTYVNQLESENTYLRRLLHAIYKENGLIDTEIITDGDKIDVSTKNIKDSNSKKSANEKIKLFRSLFRGRDDVFSLRWENKNGRSGYSPACSNEWVKPLCQKPKIKCNQCLNKNLSPLTDKVIYNHLTGKTFVGIYPLLQDDTCHFLAVDFDKETWKKDATAFFKTCNINGVPALLERSQSGRGAHVWIFFSEPIQAQIARNLGTGLLTLTMQENPHLSMDSYDRLFPNQDTLPKGGYGNLIALPLQGARRKQGNSIFLNKTLNPYADPWDVLENVKRLSVLEVTAIIKKISDDGSLLDITLYSETADDKQPWLTKSKGSKYPVIEREHLPEKIDVVLSNLIYIETNHLPLKLVNKLRKLATFQNPEFYRAQAMRLSTYGKPRIISCSEIFYDHIGLPRGCRQDVENLLNHYQISATFIDKTNSGKPISCEFCFELRHEQQKVFSEIIKYRYGVLAACTAFGKTVLAGKVIAKRKTNTLILVHRQQLLEQWQEKLSAMLNTSDTRIGTLAGGKNKLTGDIDIAMLQSLSTKGEVKPLVSEYGQVIVDECHHLSAFTFEQILKKANPRYVLGLTATPKRKDGHQPIITMQCGPILYQMSSKAQTEASRYEYKVIVKHTSLDLIDRHSTISEIYKTLSAHKNRNQAIFNDVLQALEKGRKPILLTERTDHLQHFEDKLRNFVKHVFVLRGGLSATRRKQILKELFSLPSQEERLILATGRYIGEGFDDPRLDTLFLTLPISWQGTLQQYVGRLHRHHDDKNEIQVYDYADSHIPMLNRMYQKRLRKYISMGYRVEEIYDET